MVILVTGATGTIGSQVIKHLAGQGVRVKGAVHSPQKAEQLKKAGAEPVPLDFTNGDSLRSALKGVDTLFSLTPLTPDMAENANRLTDAAKAAGVIHIVRLSGMGCEHEAIQLGRWHRAAERHIESSGIPYTFLRPNSLMQNFVHFPPINGAYYLPLGSGRISYVDARDVGAAAAAALTKDGHEGKAYTLTGPAAITAAEVAAHIAKATGKDIRHVDVPEEAARSGMAQAGMPPWLVDALMELHGIGKAGHASAVTGNIRLLTGKEPAPFEQFAHDYADKI